MNLKIIINSLLLIIVLHLFLQNLDYSIDVGNKKNTLGFLFNSHENFDNFNSMSSENELNNDSRDDLLKYLENDDSPSASNSNLEKNSIPNLQSDNQDLSKFFKIYDNLDEKELDSTLKDINQYEMPQQVKEPTNELENQWQYKNEMPMNGGSMGSIVGFDNLDGNYASVNFNNEVQNQDNVQDLRNGMSQREM